MKPNSAEIGAARYKDIRSIEIMEQRNPRHKTGKTDLALRGLTQEKILNLQNYTHQDTLQEPPQYCSLRHITAAVTSHMKYSTQVCRKAQKQAGLSCSSKNTGDTLLFIIITVNSITMILFIFLLCRTVCSPRL